MSGKRIRTGCVIGVFLALCIVFGIYDLQISAAVFHPSWRVLHVLESLGMLAAPVFLIFSGVCIVAATKNRQYRISKIATGMICIAVSAGYCVIVAADVSVIVSVVFSLCTALAVFLFVRYLSRASDQVCDRLLQISWTYLLAVVFTLVSVCVLKLFWGRVRFRQLGAADDFSPWFLPQGVTGFVSFPSGHTANAALLFILALLVPDIKHRAGKWVCYALPAVWTIVMAASRVMIGAHYASDVLFGAVISFCSLYAAKWIVLKKRAQLCTAK